MSSLASEHVRVHDWYISTHKVLPPFDDREIAVPSFESMGCVWYVGDAQRSHGGKDGYGTVERSLFPLWKRVVSQWLGG